MRVFPAFETPAAKGGVDLGPWIALIIPEAPYTANPHRPLKALIGLHRPWRVEKVLLSEVAEGPLAASGVAAYHRRMMSGKRGVDCRSDGDAEPTDANRSSPSWR